VVWQTRAEREAEAVITHFKREKKVLAERLEEQAQTVHQLTLHVQLLMVQ
jgi:hypothetical protein